MPRKKQQPVEIPLPPELGPAPPPDSERIRWLLGFLQADVASMRWGDLINARDDVDRYLHEPDRWHDAWLDKTGVRARDGDFASMAMQRGVLTGPLPKFERVVRGRLSDLHQQLRAGTDALGKGARWEPFARGATPRWQMVSDPFADGRVLLRRYAGDWMATSIAAAADLLLQSWPQLKSCEGCGVLFVPDHGRTRFHASDCGGRSRGKKWREKKKAEELKRQRDYQREKLLRIKPEEPRRRGKRKARTSR